MKISISKSCLLIIIIYLSNHYAFGSPPVFKGVTKADGLSDLLVNVIYQDSTGFIWFGTGRGLDRFDGIKIKHHPFENAIQGQRIRVNAICETTRGQIWVGNALGLWKLDENTGHLARVLPETINHPVNALFFDQERLYIGTERGFFVYDFASIEQVNIDSNAFSLSNNIRGITKDDAGLFWLATVNSVIAYNPENNEVVEYDSRETFHAQVNFRNIAYLKNKLYIGTYNTGIICFDINTGQFASFVDVGSNIISSVSTNGEDMIFVSTDGNGVFFISHDQKEIVQSFRHDVNDPESIRSNSVYSMLVDDMKRLWIGFYQDGVDYTLYQSGLFHVYSLQPHFSSLNLTVRSFLIHDHEKLVGTRDGLYYINEKENRIQYFNRSDLESDLILSIAYYRDEYYIGTYGAGIYILNPRTGSLRRFPVGNDDVLQRGQVFCFRPDEEGNLWIGSSEGVARYNGLTGEMTLFTSMNSPLPEGNVYEVFFDSERKGWFCTDKGLALFDPTTGSIRTNLFPANFFHNEKIHVMYEDEEHQLYFLPEKGDFFVSNLSMTSFSRNNKLPDFQANIYTSIVEDDSGCLWLSSDGGLVRFCNKEYTVFNYMHGIPSPTFTHYAAYKDSDGVLWFGNTRGLLYVNPAEIPEADQQPSTLVFSDLFINGKPLSMIELKRLLEGKQVAFKHDQNNLVFRFSDLSYTHPSAILVEYKMDDIDDDWKFIAGQNEISYFNLSPGKYTFRLRLPGNDHSEISLGIKIEKSMFLVPFLLSLLVIFILFMFFVLKRKRKSLVMDEGKKPGELAPQPKENEKYKMNRHSKEECDVLYEKLNRYMQDEKPYMKKDLKIGDLADSLDTSSHSLSYLFNQHLNISYYDFVNDWRITEFKKLVAEDTSSKYTLDVLADLCGFSSRTSFFRSFKKSTGITPNEYIKSLKND